MTYVEIKEGPRSNWGYFVYVKGDEPIWDDSGGFMYTIEDFSLIGIEGVYFSVKDEVFTRGQSGVKFSLPSIRVIDVSVVGDRLAAWFDYTESVEHLFDAISSIVNDGNGIVDRFDIDGVMSRINKLIPLSGRIRKYISARQWVYAQVLEKLKMSGIGYVGVYRGFPVIGKFGKNYERRGEIFSTNEVVEVIFE